MPRFSPHRAEVDSDVWTGRLDRVSKLMRLQLLVVGIIGDRRVKQPGFYINHDDK